MRTLKFTAAGQGLYKTTNERIAPGSKGYLSCEFALDSEWDGMQVIAAFYDESGEEHAVELEGCACQVPDEVTDGRAFRVALVGVDGDVRMTTNKVLVMQEGR